MEGNSDFFASTSARRPASSEAPRANKRKIIVVRMNRRTLLGAAAAAAALSAVSPSALAIGERPITIVVPWPAGGPLDVAARTLAEAVAPDLGNVIVENRPGAGGNRGVSSVAKAKPDGRTLVVGAVATHAINPSLFRKLPYDPVKDFTPITLIAHVPNVLVITPEFQKKTGIKSVKDLIAYAKKNPGKLNYASGGNGSAGHMAGELFKAEAGINMVHVPFQGAGPAKMSVLSGQTQLIFDNLASATSNINAGKFVPLAVTTVKRAKALPKVPTMIECGVKNFNISTWYGLFVPAKTPRATVDRLNAAFTKALRSKPVVERLARQGGEASPTTSEEFAALIREEIPKYARIVKISGARVD